MELLTNRLADAFAYALEAHSTQSRKILDIPYLTHLMNVSSLILSHGGTETEAIAGLLHDTVEDQGGRERLEDVRRRFGDEIAGIVKEVSEHLGGSKPPWPVRKEKYTRHLREEASPSALFVAAADKVDNLRSITSDYRELGERIWKVFNNQKEQQRQLYRRYEEALREGADRIPEDRRKDYLRLVGKLSRARADLEELLKRP
jgi:(p)ppGpp synthase/HD superfamily hydrolase